MEKEKEQNTICPYMAKKNNVIENIIKAMAIIGGAWLTIELFKMVGKKETFYNCPNCGYDEIKWGMKECPNCHVKLKYPDEK